MSFLSSTRLIPLTQFTHLARPQFTRNNNNINANLIRSSVPHRLNSSGTPKSSRPTSSSAPNQSRSNFPIIPLVIIFALGSGSYALLVKSRTGVNQSRPSN
ncbi:uncharacterized protein N7469_000781 [Penicillium citrinum]|uniref:Transmembrane protein n=1 Tax=Penicillium citrinum TaxID=5077 RepID=A0A9W9TVR1_PENCI|nr:uncharacterized protein N7469_000781 [Penicillium citrinum]KAJ5242454.1 hypothetical protein N7469_000781 [Penicillium citrinum]KAK5806894.1 hypothetical protein VI817_001152 [Penicillium citrinum]